MKSIMAIVVALISFIALPAVANDNDKVGMYVTGKMGASIVNMTGQEYVHSGYADPADNGVRSGSNHRTGVFGGGVALGYDFSHAFDVPMRVELDFMARDKAENTYNTQNRIRQGVHQTRDVKNQVKLNTLMVNGYYDFKNESAFTPYVSAGLGWAAVDLKSTRVDHRDGKETFSETRSHTSNNFAWSLGLGVAYEINDDFNIDLGYRYLDAGKADVSASDDNGTRTSKVKVKSNDIMLGVTYRF